ncbi:MAG: TolC family protein, partial [Thermodesulfobacteriota bacterium]
MLLEKNLDITIKRITPEIEESRVEKEKGEFDPELSVSLNRKDTTTPLNSRSSLAAGGAANSTSKTLTLDSKITGKTIYGTEYEVGFDNSETKSTFNSFDPEYDAFAGIVITQPLLKNYGSDNNLFQIKTAEKNREIAHYEFKSLVIDKIVEFQMSYWDLVLAIENLKVNEESLRLAESLFDRNRKKLNAGVISPLEVTQAEAGAASRKEGVIIGKRDVENKKNGLKRFISADLFALRGIDIIPTNEPPTRVVTIDLNQSIESALKNRPEYLKAKIDIDKKDIKIKYDRNQLFPRIDIEASYGFNGLGESIGDSVEDLTNNVEWLVGVA